MLTKFKTIHHYLSTKAIEIYQFLSSPRSERGEESASVAAITGLVLLVILVVMAIFRGALVAAFERIAALLAF